MPDALPIIDPSQELASAYVLPAEDIVEQARNFRVLLPQSECQQDNPEEIVVCAPTSTRDQRLVYSGPPPRPMMDELGEALYFKIGPVELGSIPTEGGARGLGMRIKF